MITLDTSAVVALVNRSDVRHGEAARALADHGGPTVVPLAILAEVAQVLDDRLGSIATVGFLRGLEQGDSLLDCGDTDVPRIRELMARFADIRINSPFRFCCWKYFRSRAMKRSMEVIPPLE